MCKKVFLCLLLSLCMAVFSEHHSMASAGKIEQASTDGENASNPLSKSTNTDLKVKYLELTNDRERFEYTVDGSFMLNPKLKIKYELHYWDTDVTGQDESDFESVHLKAIYFPKDGVIKTWKYRLAGGVEWIYDFDNANKGIGSGSDQISPFLGIALASEGGLMLIPLVQHYTEYDGPDVNMTAFRVIAMQSFSDHWWGKLDLKIPFDWENDNEIPASAELQIGKMLTPQFGLYLDSLFGIGCDRPYDYGVGFGIRFKY